MPASVAAAAGAGSIRSWFGAVFGPMRVRHRHVYNLLLMTSSGYYVRCRSCQRNYFYVAQARHCPHCGQRIRWLPKHLKVWVLVMIVMALVTFGIVDMAGGG